jgi:hypothetical protein
MVFRWLLRLIAPALIAWAAGRVLGRIGRSSATATP